MTRLADLEAMIERQLTTFALVGDALVDLHTPKARTRKPAGQFGPVRPPRKKPYFPTFPDPPLSLWDLRRAHLVREAVAETLTVERILKAALRIARPDERRPLEEDRGWLIHVASIYIERAFRERYPRGPRLRAVEERGEGAASGQSEPGTDGDAAEEAG